MNEKRYLTKSRFKLALECPTKLYYTCKKEYPDTKKDDSFLEALAEGGFQVGELAKCYFPEGHDIKDLDYKKSLKKTNELLKQENVTIFEAAIQYQNLFIRVDILQKEGNLVRLIEVKAKSYSEEDDRDFLNKAGSRIDSGWKPYLYDVAFQKYVIAKAFPQCKVKSYLMLADKTAQASVNGLNQKFVLEKRNDRTTVKRNGDVSLKALGKRILIQIPVDNIVDMIWKGKDDLLSSLRRFPEWIEYFAEKYEKDEKIITHLEARKCQHCEFKADQEQEASGLRNGFKECWKNALKWSDEDFNKPNIFELWNCRKKQTFMDHGKYFLADLTEEDLDIKLSGDTGLSTTERQWLQVEKTVKNDRSGYFDKAGFNSEFRNWKFPLHFIDFETTAVAIPFNKGRRPYEGVAFQFSHHIMSEDGSVEHKGQYINTDRGKFPNFDFIRALKSELDKDEGTIFRYAAHENTFLNIIFDQLRSSNENDKEELFAWIKTVTKSRKDSVEQWEGERNMVDMLELVKKYYYNPLMKGSNSIKAVLPAVLRTSDLLKEKYSKPIYGTEPGIKSYNFKDWAWYQKDADGIPRDPYKLLPSLFEDISADELENFITDSRLADGGTAMTAYAKMQFMEMSDIERDSVVKGLLQYCELDTLAMVMIMEDWIHISATI
ncbi:MAG: DUF2779 domain-containing protein [Candidatus Delongbacteria bacterium]|nr:DUF2779 domain-containing protein [Candidatus Delongbacteria bacterium]